MLALLHLAQSSFIGIDSSSSAHSASNDIVLYFFEPAGAALNSYYAVNFPAGFTFLAGSVPCFDALGSVTPNCVLAGLTLYIYDIAKDAALPAGSNLAIALTITNPSFSGQFTISLQLFSPALVSTDSQFLTIFPGTCLCSLQLVTSMTSEYSSLAVTVTPSVRLEPSFSLRVVPPQGWQFQIGSQSPIGFTLQVECTPVSSGPRLSCSNIKSGLDQYILVTNLVQQTTTGSVTFQVHYIFNPPTTNPAEGVFSVSIYTALNQLIDTVAGVALPALSPSPISFASCTTAPDTVSSLATLTLSFTTKSSMTTGDRIRLTFPAELGLNFVSAQFAGSAVTATTSGSTLTLNAVPAANNFKAAGNYLLVLQSVNIPASIAPVLIQLSTTRGGFSLDSGTVQVRAVRRSLTCTASSSNTAAGNLNSVTATISHPVPWDSNTALVMQLSSCPTSSPSSICSQVSASLVRLTGFFATSSLASVTITFSIVNKIAPTEISVTSLSRGVPSQFCTLSIGSTAAVIPSAKLSAVSSSSFTYSPTTLTISYTPSNSIPTSSVIQVQLATFTVPAAAKCACGGKTVVCTLTGYDLKIKDCFSSTVTTPLPVTIQGLLTPPSLAPATLAFSVAFQGNPIQTGSMTLTLTQPSPLDHLDLTSSNLIVGKTTTLTLAFAYSLGIFSGLTLRLSLSSLSSPATLTCTSSVASVCTVTAGVLQLVFTGSPATKMVSVSLPGFTNPSDSGPLTLSATIVDATWNYRSSTTIYTPVPDQLALTLSYSKFALLAAATISITVACQPGAPFSTVVFPPEFTSVSCGSGCSVSSQTVTFTGSSASVTAINPPVTSGARFQAFTKSASGYKICELQTSVTFSLQCSLPCAECASATPSVCLSCYPAAQRALVSGSIYLYQGSCLTVCPASTFLVVSTCSDCPVGCSSCSSASVCSACLTAYFFLSSSCLLNCGTGFYPSAQTCLACNCPTCTSTGSCLSCGAGLFLIAGSCLSSCGVGTYGVTGYCLNCPTGCLSCTSSACTACFKPNLMPNCRPVCSAVTFPSLTFDCLPCLCLSCSTRNDLCTSCSSPLLLQDTSCTSACLLGYFPFQQVCQRCSLICSTCTSSSTCLSCNSGMSLFQSSCYNSCPSGFASVDQSCVPCDAQCLTCLTSVTFCLACATSLKFYRGSCRASCSSPSTESAGACLIYVSPCLTTLPCTVCAPNFYLLSGTCFSSCPPTMFADDSVGQCSSCQTPCITCVSATRCLSCNQFVQNGDCVSQCGSGYLLQQSSKTCLLCDARCVSCLGGPFICSGCNAGYLFDVPTSKCGSSCSLPYFVKGTLCVPCSTPCLTCDTYHDVCLTCPSGLLLLDGTCTQNCLPSQFSSQQKCQDCPASCTACGSLTDCTSCVRGLSLHEGSCIYSCPQQYPYSILGQCSQCLIQSCLRCSADKCVFCIKGFLLFEGQCFTYCPPSYSQSSGTCQPSQELSKATAARAASLSNLPFLSTIAGLLVLACTLLSLCLGMRTYAVGVLHSVSSSLQLAVVGQLVAYSWLYREPDLLLYLMIGSVAGNFVLGIVNLLALQTLKTDSKFEEWLEQHSAFYATLNAFSVCFGYKLTRLYFTFLFGHPALGCRLLGTQHFSTLARINKAGMLLSLLALVPACIIFANEEFRLTKLLLSSLQCVVVITFSLLLSLFWGEVSQLGFFDPDSEPVKAPKLDVQQLSQEFLKKPKSSLGQEDRLEMELMSVFDPDDYEPVPVLLPKQIPAALEGGQYRVTRKKKWYELKPICELSQGEESEGRDVDTQDYKEKSPEPILFETIQPEEGSGNVDRLMNLNYANNFHIGTRALKFSDRRVQKRFKNRAGRTQSSRTGRNWLSVDIREQQQVDDFYYGE